MRTAQLTRRKVATLLLSVFLPATALAAGASADDKVWKIDDTHTRVGFSVPHMVISDVEGRFQKISGQVVIDDKQPKNSKVSIEIDVASIDTDNDKRDDHLRSPDFFDVKKHPKMTFESTKIRKAGKGYKVTGNLTIHGVTKSVTLDVQLSKPVKNPWGQMVRAAKVKGEINRKDFGLNWNKTLETGGLLVGEEVTIDISMELNA